MKIRLTAKSQPVFNGFWNNKAVLKGLEFVSDHGASFTAGVSFVMASGARPLAIYSSPKVKKENKQYAALNSVISGGLKFLSALAVSIPIENALKTIEKQPEKYISEQTAGKLKNGAETLAQSKAFQTAAMTIKHGTGFITAVPKSMLTAALIPVIAAKLFDKKNKPAEPAEKEKHNIENKKYMPSSTVFAPVFKGSDITAEGIGRLLNIKTVQNAAVKYSAASADIARSISISTDFLLSASFAYSINKNKKLDKERKKPLILNNIYGTAFSAVCGYTLDELVKKNTLGFIKKFKEQNKNNPKLEKYIQGINTIRPVMIFAGIYYGLLPMLTLYLAEKTASKIKNEPGK